MNKPVISADSHITEPPNTYVDFIESKWKDKAPQMKYVEALGDQVTITSIAAIG